MLKLILLSIALVVSSLSGWAGTDELDQDRTNQSLQGTVVLRVDQRNGQVAMVKVEEFVDSKQEAQSLADTEFSPVPNEKVHTELDREAGAASWYWFYPGYRQGQYGFQGGYNGQGNYNDQRGYPGQPSPGQQYPDQQYPDQYGPGQQYPGQQYPGQQDGGYNNGQAGDNNQGRYPYGNPYYYQNGNCYNPWYSYAVGPFAYYIYNLYSLFWR